ncbi:MAG: hypothetical protein ACR2MX_03015 [Cyclobacteriaceae bacterium]
MGLREKIGRWIFKTAPKMEALGILVTIAGVALQKFEPGQVARSISLIGLTTLAISYFILVYLPRPSGSWLLKYLHQLFPMTCTITVLAIQFQWMDYPDSNLLMKLITIVLPLSLIGFGWLKWVKSRKMPFLEPLVLRVLLLFAILLALDQGWFTI